jgi:hypothetical protein
MLQQILKDRIQGMKFFVRALMKNGLLQEGLTLSEAAETAWALTCGEVFTLLVKDRSWPADKYMRWLAKNLAGLLLP